MDGQEDDIQDTDVDRWRIAMSRTAQSLGLFLYNSLPHQVMLRWGGILDFCGSSPAFSSAGCGIYI